MWHQCPTGWDKDLLSEALVPAQGQPSFLQGPAGWPGPDRGDCSGGLHRPAVWIRGAVCLLAGVERAGTANVQVCCWGPGQSGELDQSPAVSQSQLPGPARDGHWEEVQRWETERLKESCLCSGEQLCEVLNQCLQTPCTSWHIHCEHKVTVMN